MPLRYRGAIVRCSECQLHEAVVLPLCDECWDLAWAKEGSKTAAHIAQQEQADRYMSQGHTD